ncbi:hypothetical protein SE17_28585, partial [Kouleothrix aurantiaca]
IHVLETLVGRRYGGSTGTIFFGACCLIADMAARGEAGALVMLGCDAGELYRDTYYSPEWLRQQGIDIAPACEQMRALLAHGAWSPGAIERADAMARKLPAM